MKRAAVALAVALAASPALAQHQGHGPAPEPVEAEDGADEEALPSAQLPPEAMTGALGPYPTTREASGTAWQPEASPHAGAHVTAGRWSLMGHATLFGTYDRQGGPRGGEKVFVSGMAMGMARRPVGPGLFQLRAGLSPDPLMGRRGFPLLLASGETADGATPLVDRQHPHDFFVELSASYSLPISEGMSLFAYAGLPGEPAFGPPPFMHRLAAQDSPEAPISHHWLDSTHVSFGVVTAGIVAGDVKLEASRFNGREPDQKRFDIETGPLDSTALRLSWNPARTLSLQASWAHLTDPEQLKPGEDQTRWSASALYARPLGRKARWSTTLAWGRRSREHGQLDAFLLESSVSRKQWTLFGRAERTENDELGGAGGHHGPAYRVGKVSLGAMRDFRAAPHVRLGFGGLWAFNFVPAGLEPSYGGDRKGGMLFLRLKID
ncbi:MAG TPA: hypothetical protein VFP12_02135 [Allosphingosinicella sp.]|nr:hypothetical protein [Allosphingosinicella sp.]